MSDEMLPPLPQSVMTSGDVLRRLAISRSTLMRMRRTGKLPPVGRHGPDFTYEAKAVTALTEAAWIERRALKIGITCIEAANMLGLDRSTVNKLHHQGKFGDALCRLRSGGIVLSLASVQHYARIRRNFTCRHCGVAYVARSERRVLGCPRCTQNRKNEIRRAWYRRHHAAVAVLLMLAFVAYARTADAQTSANFDYARISTEMVLGSTTFGDSVLRVVGSSSVSTATGTVNPMVIDSDGDVLEDSNTTVTTGGNYTFSGTLGGSSGILGLATSAVSSGYFGARGTVPITASGVDEVRLGVRATFGLPEILMEDAGFPQWSMQNSAGGYYLFRRDSAGNLPDDPPFALQLTGNMIVGPPGRRILPYAPYGVDIGSQQYKFGALWTGDLYADRLVTIENIGTIDNRWLIGSGNLLDEDLSPSATTMIARYNNYLTGTFVYLQKFARTEFVKTTSGPTLTNHHPNASFENGLVNNWTGVSNASVSNVTTKSYHGERSLLIDATGNPSTVAYSGAGLATFTTYTTCLYVRRVDGAAMADGDVGIYQASGYVYVPVQSTQTDGWYRVCRTSATENPGGGNFLHIDTKGVDMYMDAAQSEATTIQRPYSEYRASYTIARNQEGTGQANQWYAGDGMFGVGAASPDGWLDCYAIRGTKSATEQGPACVANVRTGSNFNDWAPFAAWGNLDGLYGISGTRWGFRAGYRPLTAIGADSVEGFTIKHNDVMKVQFDTSGNGFLDGSLTVRNNITVGTSGALMSGATAYDTGTGYWLDYNGGTPRFRIGTTSAGTSYLRWTGSALELKSDDVTINASGLVIGGVASNSDWQPDKAYRFDFGDGQNYGLSMWSGGGGAPVQSLSSSRNGTSAIFISVQNTTNTDAIIGLQSWASVSVPSRITLNSDQILVNGNVAFSGSCAASATLTVVNGLITGGC